VDLQPATRDLPAPVEHVGVSTRGRRGEGLLESRIPVAMEARTVAKIGFAGVRDRRTTRCRTRPGEVGASPLIWVFGGPGSRVKDRSDERPSGAHVTGSVSWIEASDSAYSVLLCPSSGRRASLLFADSSAQEPGVADAEGRKWIECGSSIAHCHPVFTSSRDQALRGSGTRQQFLEFVPRSAARMRLCPAASTTMRHLDCHYRHKCGSPQLANRCSGRCTCRARAGYRRPG